MVSKSKAVLFAICGIALPSGHLAVAEPDGFGHVPDHQPDGNITIFQTRVEVDV